MEIRYITSEDNAFEISSIYEKSWKVAYQNIIPQSFLDNIPIGKWANNIKDEGINSLVIVEDNIIIGTASFSKSRWAAYENYGEIISIYFLPEYIGKGYGKHLLQACIKELKKLGFHHIIVRVLEDNHKARRFYEMNNFAFSGKHQTETIGGKKLKELLYEYKMK